MTFGMRSSAPGMKLTGKFELLQEDLVQSIEHGIWGERRLEMRRPGLERIFTPGSSSLDQIEAARWGHS